MSDPLAQQLPLAGSRLLTGGARPQGEGREAGCYYQPTIIEGLANDSPICREEIFGPLLVALPFDDEDDLLPLANDSGIGREKGRLGILEYMEQKSLYWGINVAPLPWAA